MTRTTARRLLEGRANQDQGLGYHGQHVPFSHHDLLMSVLWVSLYVPDNSPIWAALVIGDAHATTLVNMHS